MPPLPDLNELIETIDDTDGLTTDLDRLLAAEGIASYLNWLGDRLVGCLIEEVRAEGRSWTDIGDQLGISRQGAQQRYASRLSSLTVGDLSKVGVLKRLTARAHESLERAEGHAQRLGYDAIAPEHLLLALLDDEGSIAVKAVLACGVVPQHLRPSLEAPGNLSSPRSPAVGGVLRKCLDSSFSMALSMSHNYVGTEHLLLGLIHERKNAAAQALSDEGMTLPTGRHAVQKLISDYLATHH
ncbi:Clp protease N-terminal domain-containing protein [Streptomyces sp. NPDC059076]|uniref:Clp protease N-terminal domain-containing protein n=1 Tax=unclassified Streptomyces TaxID=2593676 RepID=UPI0036A60B3A